MGRLTVSTAAALAVMLSACGLVDLAADLVAGTDPDPDTVDVEEPAGADPGDDVAAADVLCDSSAINDDVDALSWATRTAADRGAGNYTDEELYVVEDMLRGLHDRADVSGYDRLANDLLTHIAQVDELNTNAQRWDWVGAARRLLARVIDDCLPSEDEMAQDREQWLSDRGHGTAGSADVPDADWSSAQAYRNDATTALHRIDDIVSNTFAAGDDDPEQLATAMYNQVPHLDEVIDTFAGKTPPEGFEDTHRRFVAVLQLFREDWEMLAHSTLYESTVWVELYAESLVETAAEMAEVVEQMQ